MTVEAELLEIQRITDHIHRAETIAARRDVSALDRVQRLVRQLLLRALAAYRAGGRFPQNRDFATQTPYFIDGDGTRCAMAHLLELGGERDLVAHIAANRNHAYVRELADEPRLLAWLAAAGLTVEEAAAIQPSYCQMLSDCFCGGPFSSADYPLPAKGVLEAVVGADNIARVEQIYGDSMGITVGADVHLAVEAIPYPAGTRVLVPIDAATGPFHSIDIGSDQLLHCASSAGTPPALTHDQFVDAALAPSCAQQLATYNAAWSQQVGCDEEHPQPLEDRGGCSTAHGEMSIGILIALVTALVRK